MEVLRKRRKSFNTPGEAHELTFSCYRRRPLLASDEAKLLLLDSLDRARMKHEFLVWAYVIMPEHVHILIRPLRDDYDIAKILQSIKQPVGRVAIQAAKEQGTIRDFVVPGRLDVLRFWQTGGGYDRNFRTAKAIWDAIRYIHMNPVKRGLVESPFDYEWSSCNAYEGKEDVPFRIDRCEVWGS